MNVLEFEIEQCKQQVYKNHANLSDIIMNMLANLTNLAGKTYKKTILNIFEKVEAYSYFFEKTSNYLGPK